ncbi:hypothetical protein NMG60_11020989 [Bertholletia excelsa]
MTITTKQDAAVAPTPTPSICMNCGAEERRLLHHVRHRGNFRRLCTSCVLRLHPQSFCPTCFLVYDRSPPASTDSVTCFKCYSSSHSPCVGANATSPYVCPLCANPHAPIFAPKKTSDGQGRNWRAIDKKAAKVLLAAARIAANSMSKAALVARAEAERRVKEAAFTRKRAREGLEHVAFLVAKEKVKRKESSSVEVSGSANATARDRYGQYQRAVNPINLGTQQNRIGNQRVVDGVDGANEVSARLNAVGLREKERVQGFGGQSSGSGPRSNGAAMAVEDCERLRVNAAASAGVPCVQNNGNERSATLGHLEKNGTQGEKANGLHPVPPVGEEVQHKQNNHGGEENIGSHQ